MRALPRALPWLIALLVGITYLPALDASFQFDDWQAVLDDPRVQSIAAWWQSMPGMRALVKLSYAVNHTWSDSAASFRAVNVLLHMLNTALVFLFTRALVLRWRTAAGSADAALMVAACVSLVFGLHPVQTESVTYIAARSNLIATLFSLLALLAWLRGRNARAWCWYPLATLCFVLALAGKETAAMLPFAMMLCLAAERDASKREWALPLGLCALCAVLLALLWPLTPYDYLVRTSLETRTPIANLVAQTQGISWLAGQLVRWDLLNADPMLVPRIGFNGVALIEGAVLAAAFVTGLLTLRRSPALGFGILWCFLWLAPTNSLLARLDLANDRQWYLALLGPAWCAAHGLWRLSRFGTRSTVVAAMAVIGAVLAWGTVSRNRVYDTEVSFWTDVVDKAPHNSRGWNNLGMAHAQACERERAGAAFGQAMRNDPDDFRAAVNLALLEAGELPGVPARCP